MPLASFLPSGICHRELDIGKEHTKLDELQAELRKPELRASRIQYPTDHEPGSEDEMGDEG